jgi:hypothetical protein
MYCPVFSSVLDRTIIVLCPCFPLLRVPLHSHSNILIVEYFNYYIEMHVVNWSVCHACPLIGPIPVPLNSLTPTLACALEKWSVCHACSVIGPKRPVRYSLVQDWVAGVHEPNMAGYPSPSAAPAPAHLYPLLQQGTGM